MAALQSCSLSRSHILCWQHYNSDSLSGLSRLLESFIKLGLVLLLVCRYCIFDDQLERVKIFTARVTDKQQEGH
jgi:hypothetical protein